MKKEITVYIASPYTNGWMPANVRRQMDVGNQLIDLGYFPYIPLLTHFLEMYNSRPESQWLELDFVFVKKCDAVLRLKPIDADGKEILSHGADLEEKTAKENNIPVFYSIDDLNDHFKSEYKQMKLL